MDRRKLRAGMIGGGIGAFIGPVHRISWKQEQPESLLIRDLESFETVLYKGGPYLHETAKSAARLPGGHPDGLIVAFANLYQEFFRAIWRQLGGGNGSSGDFPNIDDGVRGMSFVETVLESAGSDNKWTRLKI